MTPDQLQTQLADEFELVCFVDLADLRSKHSTAFRLFEKAHRTEFLANQRLVLYSGYHPEQEFLCHIQRAATTVDISNWFILLITPADISTDLVYANANYGNDDIAISNRVLNLCDTKSFDQLQIVLSPSVCAYPFMKMDIREDQSVTPCCKTSSLGNIGTASIQDIFHGSRFEHLKTSMIRGERPAECSACWLHDDQGVTSLRQLSLLQYQRLLDFEYYDDAKIKQLDISPTSLCNFKCRICNATSSTQIATEELKFATTPERQNQMRKLLIDSRERPKKLMQVIREYQWQDLEYIHLFGGEPLLWPGLDEFIVYLIDIGRAPHINLIINTNCSVFPKNIDNLVRNFKTVDFMLSIDDVGQRFEIQRGGSWSDVYKNIQKYSQLQSTSLHVQMCPAVNVQNLLYLDQLVDLARSVNLEIVWCYLENPIIFNIDHITQKTKELVYHKYSNHADPELRKIAHKVMQTPPVSGQNFLAHMKLLDDRRGQDFRSSHKEIYDAMSQ